MFGLASRFLVDFGVSGFLDDLEVLLGVADDFFRGAPLKKQKEKCTVYTSVKC